MEYKVAKQGPDVVEPRKPKPKPIFKARSYNDICTLQVFLEGEWLKENPKRRVVVLRPANEYLWPVHAIITYDKERKKFYWTEPYNNKRYEITSNGKIGKEVKR